MADKNDYRLFKLARELNLSSGSIVEFLHKQGHAELVEDLNAKLNHQQYEQLLKQFAPDKLSKIKVEDTPQTLVIKDNEEGDTHIVPTHQLKAGLDNIQKPKVVGKIDLESFRRKTPPPPAKKEEPLVEHKVEMPSFDEIKPILTFPIAPPAAEKVENKVVEKIEVPVIVETAAPVVSENKTVTEEKKPLTTEPESKPLAEEKKEGQDRHSSNHKHELKKVARKDSPLTDEKPVLPNKDLFKRDKPQITQDDKTHDKTVPYLTENPNTQIVKPVAKGEPENIEVEDSPEPLEVIRASGNVPQLSGLKVLGKIDLESSKKKKSNSNTNKDRDRKRERVNLKDAGTGTGKVLVKSTSPEKDKERLERENRERPVERPVGPRTKIVEGKVVPLTAEELEEEAKRKRRRKRKRKKTGPETPIQQTISQPKDKANIITPQDLKKRKDRPGEKIVQRSIKSTLQEMQKGAGRSRQMARRDKRDTAAKRREDRKLYDDEQSLILRITEFITANEFANLLEVPVNEIIKKCWELGKMVNLNQRLDAEELSIIAEEYGFEIEFIDVTEEDLAQEADVDLPEDIVKRNPVITVMGHVDHGKTTLLDYLRKANVVASEAGGITQHIGAYQVKLKTEDTVTFLDTPGHEAFTAMRARGTKVTDVAIIVIAADDSVMPTTKEAISHAQAGNVPMVFAINKIDKDGADPERIRTQLSQMNLLVDTWGGKFPSQDISAKKGINIDDLLEKVILESEILDLKANPKRHANGSVIESRLDKGRGNVVTLLVQNGTLRVGDVMVGGIYYGKVRAIYNQKGEKIKEAGPSMPVQILGLAGLPTAGDKFQVYSEDSKAKEIATKRQELYREHQLRQTKRITLEEIGRRKLIGNFRELNIIIKGDVDGSVEALAGALLKLSSEEVAVNIILKGTGAISEGDILLATASDALIIAFNVRPNAKARDLSEKEGISIRTYSVIYNAIDDVKAALEGMLAPEMQEEITGTLEIREVFKVTKVGNVAGCYVTSGKVERANPIRLIRDGVVMAETTISTLKRFKDDVKEVTYGYECGVQINGFGDIQQGDIIESYKVKEVKRKLA